MSSQLNLLIDSCKEDLNAIEELVEIARCINYILKEYSAVAEYDLKKYYPDLYIMLRKVRKERILKFILDNMVKGKNEGLYRENMNIDILSRISLSHIDSMFDSEVIIITEFLERPSFIEYFEYHLRGIVNASGLKILEDQLQKLEDSK
jgi:hypothetical protein